MSVVISQDYTSEDLKQMRRAFRMVGNFETFPIYELHVTVYITEDEFRKHNPSAPKFDKFNNCEWEVTEEDIL